MLSGLRVSHVDCLEVAFSFCVNIVEATQNHTWQCGTYTPFQSSATPCSCLPPMSTIPTETRPPIAPKIQTSPIRPTRDQTVVLYVVCVFPSQLSYTLRPHPHILYFELELTYQLQIVVYTVVIFALWNIPGIRTLIYPFKLLTIGFHELCHIIAVCLSITYPPYFGPRSSHAYIVCLPPGNPNRRNRHRCHH